MSDTSDTGDTGDIGVPAPKPKRKWPPKRKRPYQHKTAPRIVPESVLPGEFLGLTERDCCNDCMGGICYITKPGSGICGHPRKGGLQSADLSRPAVAERYRRAKIMLEHAKVERRG